jgi:hypothetical protein
LKTKRQALYAEEDTFAKKRSSMHTLPVELLPLIVEFAPYFSKPVWAHAHVLLMGAILAPGKRTVTAALRVMGLSEERHFQNYHRVLNRASWSNLLLARVLLGVLVKVFAPEGALILGLDDTIERRRGEQITAKGIYRDPVRSSHSHFVKASGLRWLCAMLLVDIPWAQRVWALPVLTALCPSERFYEKKPRVHKKLTAWARQLIVQLRRWLPGRELIFVGDSSYAVIDLLGDVQRMGQVSLITRLRLDAALYDLAPPRPKHTKGRPRLKGKRRPPLQQVADDPTTPWTKLKLTPWYGEAQREVEVCTDTAIWYHAGKAPVAVRWVLIRDPQDEFATQALLSTNLAHAPQQMLEWFVRRWTIEVTFEEARAHLGIETQRQWSKLAIARTTPLLFGLFSLITLLAHELMPTAAKPIRAAAWYAKELPTFSDAIALVRRQLWSHSYFSISGQEPDLIKIPRSLLARFTDALCYAA